MKARVDMVHVDTDHKSVDDGLGLGGMCQVVLYNDNQNTCEHVVSCLESIFKHSHELAQKLMMEAHQRGRTIAQVESKERAEKHAGQLAAAGLKAEVEEI